MEKVYSVQPSLSLLSSLLSSTYTFGLPQHRISVSHSPDRHPSSSNIISPSDSYGLFGLIQSLQRPNITTITTLPHQESLTVMHCPLLSPISQALHATSTTALLPQLVAWIEQCNNECWSVGSDNDNNDNCIADTDITTRRTRLLFLLHECLQQGSLATYEYSF